MKTFGRSTAAAFGLDTQVSRTAQMVPAQTWRVRRLIDALQSLDDRTLSQIGIERSEIERFAQTEVAHRFEHAAGDTDIADHSAGADERAARAT